MGYLDRHSEGLEPKEVLDENDIDQINEPEEDKVKMREELAALFTETEEAVRVATGKLDKFRAYIQRKRNERSRY